MSNNINALQDKIDDLVEDIKADSELILTQIDVEQLVKDPEAYIRELAEEFVHQHEAEIRQGVYIGRKYAQKFLKGAGRADTGKS